MGMRRKGAVLFLCCISLCLVFSELVETIAVDA